MMTNGFCWSPHRGSEWVACVCGSLICPLFLVLRTWLSVLCGTEHFRFDQCSHVYVLLLTPAVLTPIELYTCSQYIMYDFTLTTRIALCYQQHGWRNSVSHVCWE